MFTPGGIGATLSPTSAIFLTTVPANGARMTVFCELRLREREVRGVALCGRRDELRRDRRAPARARPRRCERGSLWLRAASRGTSLLGDQSARGLTQLPARFGQIGLGALDGRVGRTLRRGGLLHLRLRARDAGDEVGALQPGDHLAFCTRLPSSTRSSESRPWIFGDDGLAARDEIAGGGQHGRARRRLDVRSTLGETVETSTAALTLRHASAPPPRATTITPRRIHSPLRDVSGASLMRSDARSAFKSLTCACTP